MTSTCGIKYPARFLPGYLKPEVPDMHSTLIFLGPVEEMKVGPLLVTHAAKQAPLPYVLMPDVIGTDLFGPDKDVPVLLLEPSGLEMYREAVERSLSLMGVFSGSEFSYRPHVSVNADIMNSPPSEVVLGRPQLWWGDNNIIL